MQPCTKPVGLALNDTRPCAFESEQNFRSPLLRDTAVLLTSLLSLAEASLSKFDIWWLSLFTVSVYNLVAVWLSW